MTTNTLPTHHDIFRETCVALDLETTGLRPEQDEIIEVGAVKFRGHQSLDTFHTLVNPYIQIPPFIQQFTGITPSDVRNSPPFAAIAEKLLSFIGDCPLVGHNIAFDVAFLDRKGVSLVNKHYDTLDLARVFLPSAPDYGLARLVPALGLETHQAHRALEDADASRKVFLSIVNTALKMDQDLLTALSDVANKSEWGLKHLLANLRNAKRHISIGSLGLNTKKLPGRLDRPETLVSNNIKKHITESDVVTLLSKGGALARRFPGYEERVQQQEMAAAVVKAFNSGEHLVVEGGTGVGKSVAYLLPSILYAAQNNSRVVISTNTISLQEQLVQKDIPALIAVLQNEPGIHLEQFRHAVLKGKSNYLCLQRASHFAASETLATAEAKALAKIMVWLHSTHSGDRTELNLGFRDWGIWDRLSATKFAECAGALKQPCFLRDARAQAAAAHIIVVNHALLLSHLAGTGGSALPAYDLLVIDEAHHLEGEATRQFGFQISQKAVEDLMDQMHWALGNLLKTLRGPTVSVPRRNILHKKISQAMSSLTLVREYWGRLCGSLASFLVQNRSETTEQYHQLGLTRELRMNQGWSNIETICEKFNLTLRTETRDINAVIQGLDGLAEASTNNLGILSMEMENALQSQDEIGQRIKCFILHPDDDVIYWMAQSGSDGSIVLNGAPLHVGQVLDEHLFSEKHSVVMTSATLSTRGTFDHIRERVGLSNATESLQGSPFDYQKSVLLLIPPDMPEPTEWTYQEMLQRALADMAIAAHGHTMVLFTSHAALQATRQGLRHFLEPKGIAIVGQGVDGSPRHLLRRFHEDPRMILLGTATFWEGVDIPEDTLKVLAIAKLPFNVPTDPVFAARSRPYKNPFNEYAVPEAVLRFRQGFGRLIRRHEDRGVVAVLDRRIISKQYGSAFLNSIPECTLKQSPLRELPCQIRTWIG